MRRILGTMLAVGLAASAGGTQAGEVKAGALEIRDAWARANPARTSTGVVFVAIVNGGTIADTLVGAAAPVAPTAELHTHAVAGEVMRMTAMSRLEIPAGAMVAMAPGGPHLMLIGLTQPLRDGDSFPLELTFARAGTITVTVDVKPLGAMGPAEPQPGADAR